MLKSVSDNSPQPSDNDQVVNSNNPLLSSGDNSTSGVDMPDSRFISSPRNPNYINRGPASATHRDFNNSGSYVNSPDDHGRSHHIYLFI